MNEWARLVDRYASELKKYELVCAFTGQSLTENNINEPCPENSKDLLDQDAADMTFFTEEVPPKSAIGNGRHWFGKPSSRGFKLSGSVFKEDASFI